ncbi:carbohydrate-binding family 6 protein [Planctomycetota bacterium]
MPQVQFALDDLAVALSQREMTLDQQSLYPLPATSAKNRIVLAVDSLVLREHLKMAGVEMGQLDKPEAFSIRITGTENAKTYWAIGADPVGTMYAGLDVAETIRLQGFKYIRSTDQAPYIAKRGLKFNIPLDARTPSYGDAGHAAQLNIGTMWEMDYWQEFIDDLARYRYNTITLWNTHPFPSIIKMADYPDVALDDVKRTTLPIATLHKNYETNSRRGVTPEILTNLETIKTISIEEKIAFWQAVMQYAQNRGISFYWFTWNTFVWGAEGKYGITADLKNEKTKQYYRQCVLETFKTYPLLAGIGLTAGENMRNVKTAQKEDWLYEVYAEGMNDALEILPKNRQIRLIHRGHQVNVPAIAKRFQGFKGEFNFSFKYAGAHIYGNTDPTYVDKDFDDLPRDKRAWVELRNDSIFNFRWGDPGFVRTFIQTLPGPDQLIGFMMGPDGYVWGREFTSTEPDSPRQLEIKKHWYRFMLWGRYGYTPNLPERLFAQEVCSRFPQVHGPSLYEAWTAASKIYPRITEFYWYRRDLEWAVEGCLSRKRWGNEGEFHTVRDFAFGPDPEGGNGDMIKIDTYVKRVETGQPNLGTTPVELAQEIRSHAQTALVYVDALDASSVDKALRRTISDIRCMAYLGQYYAEKILGAVELRFYDANSKSSHQAAALAHLQTAAKHWEDLAALAGSLYTPQYLARNNYLDWQALTEQVKQDIEIAAAKSVSEPN